MIIHLGEALIDFIPTTDAEGMVAFRPVPGGSAYNSSIAAARLGAHAAFLGKISHDFFGQQLLENLNANGVDTSIVRRSDGPSTLAFVKKAPDGSAQYAFFAEKAADRLFVTSDVPVLPDNAALQFGSIALIPDPVGATIAALVEREHRRRVVALDPNVRPSLVKDEGAYRARLGALLKRSSIVRLSDEDLHWISGSDDLRHAAKALLGPHTRMVVVTCGPEGSFAMLHGNRLVHVPAAPTTVVDTIGAGDSFHAAMLTWLDHHGVLTLDALSGLGGDEVEKMLRFSAAVAAITCSRAGANPPSLHELSAELRW